MKRLILIICLILSCILFINECIHISDTEQTANMYASKKKTSYQDDYIPIPKELSKQYKAEMEKIIDEEYPKVITDIDNAVKKAREYYINLQTNGYDINQHVSLVNIDEVYLPSADIDLYSKLVKITKEKYLNQKYKPYPTDCSAIIAEFMMPYFQHYNIDTSKLHKIGKYANKQSKIVKEYIYEVQKIVPTE